MDADAGSCLNCGTPLQGPHCHACGQPVKGLVRPQKNIVHDFLDTVFEYDSRIWRTLVPLYLLPGKTTRDYLAGRRMRFVLTFRLFFVLTVVTFLVLQWRLGDTSLDFGGGGAIDRAESVAELDATLAELREQFAETRRELEADPQRVYGLSGVIAAERAVVALHAHSFLGMAVLMALALGGLQQWLANGGGFLAGTFARLAAAAWWWIPIYLYVMQRRVYAQGWALTAVKFF